MDIAILLLLALVLIFQIVTTFLLLRKRSSGDGKLNEQLQRIEQNILLGTQNSQIGFRELRQENTVQARQLREEVSGLFEVGMNSLTRAWREQSNLQNQRVSMIADQMHKMQEDNQVFLDRSQTTMNEQIKGMRDENQENQRRFSDLLNKQLETVHQNNQEYQQQLRELLNNQLSAIQNENQTHHQRLLDLLSQQLSVVQQNNQDHQARLGDSLQSQLGAMLQNNQEHQKLLSDTLQQQLGAIQQSNVSYFEKHSQSINEQHQKIQENNQIHQDRMNAVLTEQLKTLQDSNERKLEQMRLTVDDKLNETLGKRLESSFKQVGDQLERVYRSMGEIQSLSSDVSSLNRVLTNVKARGTWAEVQLGNLLEQIMTKDQYETNVAVKKNSQQRVEYAIKLPGRDDDGEQVWLPIDAKFPQEDYLRILDASENSDPVALEAASKQLETRIFQEARTIRDKYITPPETTDFAIMYLPTEGLYAEVLRRTGVTEKLQREYKVTVAGPTTLAALLNSLNMGFRTLAVEKRSSEVWKLLGAIKQQYARFSEQLLRAQKKLKEASNYVDVAAKRTETINSKLKKVETLDSRETEEILGPEETVFIGLDSPL